MTGMKVLGVATVAAGADAVSLLPVDIWEKFGIVGLLLLAIVVIYKDAKADKKKLTELLERAIGTIQHNTDVIMHCKEKVK